MLRGGWSQDEKVYRKGHRKGHFDPTRGFSVEREDVS